MKNLSHYQYAALLYIYRNSPPLKFLPKVHQGTLGSLALRGLVVKVKDTLIVTTNGKNLISLYQSQSIRFRKHPKIDLTERVKNLLGIVRIEKY